MTSSLLELRGVRKAYQIRAQRWGRPVRLQAVEDVSCELGAGEIVALVGESGAGKSKVGPPHSRPGAARRRRGAL